MKKLLSSLMSCLILGACTTLTPEQKEERLRQKRQLFEQEVSRPELEQKCELPKVERPVVEVSVPLDEVPTYDCLSINFTGFLPLQKLNNREILAYVCLGLRCNGHYDPYGRQQPYHIKFPYALGDLMTNTIYPLREDICMNEDEKVYQYTTTGGLTVTTLSMKFVKKRKYSQQERQRVRKKMIEEKREVEELFAQQEYENKRAAAQREYDTCRHTVGKELLERWQAATSKQHYCQMLEEWLNSRAYLGWIGYSGNTAPVIIRSYYNETCPVK